MKAEDKGGKTCGRSCARKIMHLQLSAGKYALCAWHGKQVTGSETCKVNLKSADNSEKDTPAVGPHALTWCKVRKKQGNC